MPVLNFDHGQMHYDVTGHGPAVLFVHGSLAAGAQWRNLAQSVVNAGFTAVTADLPGYGRNEPWTVERPWTPDIDAAALKALVEELDTSVHLVTHSGGTMLSFPLLGDTPEIVRSAAWLEPSLWGLLREQENPKLREIVELATTYVAHMDAGAQEEAIEVFIDTWARRPGTWAATPEKMQEKIRRVAARLYHEWNSWLRDYGPYRPYTEDIRSLSIDPLVIKGGETIEAMNAACASLVALRPRIKVIEIEGAGHNVPFTHSEEVAGPLLDHLRSS
ncbi:alpha/beta fold hydrolase [Aestuariivita boseongensis]|uniref:alpha/beta fold hydrolase n=1 Tax=Aestuariivita boseongensis TaxID=1470562 RepID=UPI0006826881|nr:alpha/beta fold hydrolase [Aestuariivita boseongensis]